MWTLSGFADEISAEPAEQLETLTRLGMSHLDVRTAWGTRVAELDAGQLDRLATLIEASGMRVTTIGSDLGKIGIQEPFGPHLARAERVMDAAARLDCRFVRVFSFFVTDRPVIDSEAAEVLSRMARLVELSQRRGITLLIENEKDLYGDRPERLAGLVTALGGPGIVRTIIDPANYVQCGVAPVDEAWPIVGPSTAAVHAKDARLSSTRHGVAEPAPVGQGDGQWPELIAALQASGFDGVISLEPHLGDFDAFGGRSGPQLWALAHRALTELLDRAGVDRA